MDNVGNGFGQVGLGPISPDDGQDQSTGSDAEGGWVLRDPRSAGADGHIAQRELLVRVCAHRRRVERHVRSPGREPQRRRDREGLAARVRDALGEAVAGAQRNDPQGQGREGGGPVGAPRQALQQLPEEAVAGANDAAGDRAEVELEPDRRRVAGRFRLHDPDGAPDARANAETVGRVHITFVFFVL